MKKETSEAKKVSADMKRKAEVMKKELDISKAALKYFRKDAGNEGAMQAFAAQMEAIHTADALLDDVGNDGKKKKKKKDGTGKSKKEKGADGADGKKKKKKAQKPTAADDVPAKADDGAEEEGGNTAKKEGEEGGNTAKAEGEEGSEAVQETEAAEEKPRLDPVLQLRDGFLAATHGTLCADLLPADEQAKLEDDEDVRSEFLHLLLDFVNAVTGGDHEFSVADCVKGKDVDVDGFLRQVRMATADPPNGSRWKVCLRLARVLQENRTLRAAVGAGSALKAVRTAT
jgi:hypothetical protein